MRCPVPLPLPLVISPHVAANSLARAAPPYSEHPTTTASSAAPIPSQLPPRPPPSHALGPTPVSALPAAPPALWHAHVPSSYHARPHARADARARRRFCAAFVCAWIVWLVAALVLGAVVGEEIVRRSGGDAGGGGGRYAVRLWGIRGGEERAASDEGGRVVVHQTDEVRFLSSSEGSSSSAQPC